MFCRHKKIKVIVGSITCSRTGLMKAVHEFVTYTAVILIKIDKNVSIYISLIANY